VLSPAGQQTTIATISRVKRAVTIGYDGDAPGTDSDS
jgi:hypothetical protein